jgi:hypothetical protein
MGFRLSFGIGPIRYSTPLTGKRRKSRRAASPTPGKPRQAREDLRASIPPPTSFPQPAPYIYYRMTAVRADSFDLVSDEGETWDGVESDPQQIAKLQVGGRFTWDGENMENYVPADLQPEMRKRVKRLNAMPAHKRIQMRDQTTVQTMRQFGYVFDSESRLVPVGSSRP